MRGDLPAVNVSCGSVESPPKLQAQENARPMMGNVFLQRNSSRDATATVGRSDSCARLHTIAYVCLYVCMHVCAHVYIYIYIYIYIYTDTRTDTQTHTHTPTHAHTHIYIYIYIHTHTHLHAVHKSHGKKTLVRNDFKA